MHGLLFLESYETTIQFITFSAKWMNMALRDQVWKLIIICIVSFIIVQLPVTFLDDFDYKAYEAFMSRYMIILTRRSMRWNSILSQQSLPDGGTMKRFVRKGVPVQFRGKV